MFTAEKRDRFVQLVYHQSRLTFDFVTHVQLWSKSCYKTMDTFVVRRTYLPPVYLCIRKPKVFHYFIFIATRAFEEPCLTDGTIYMERYTLWREMMHSCQPVIKSVVNYIGNNLLPWWIRCQKCRKWRQIFRKIQMLPDITEGFTCSKSIKVINWIWVYLSFFT